MRAETSGVILEEIAVERVAVPASARGKSIGLGGREAARMLQDVRARRHPVPRPQRRGQPGLGRATGVERLGHRAELRLEAGRLRVGQAVSAGRSRLVELQQVSAGGRSAEGSYGARGVKAARIVAGAERTADQAGGLVAGDEGLDQRVAGYGTCLGQGQPSTIGH